MDGARKLPLYQIDAFTDRVLAGNPAAICPLQDWLPDELMQRLANENNLSETAFLVKNGKQYGLRWFTPQQEVDLCGHATLAAAWLIFNELDTAAEQVVFDTRSGVLTVTRDGQRLTMDFPVLDRQPCEAPTALVDGLDISPVATFVGMDYMAVLESEAQLRALQPVFASLAKLDRRGIIVTAPGEECDLVSRFFAPAAGINEDPVTGSAHCMLTPYWAERLQNTQLHARQLSPRGGELWCELRNGRVFISGGACLYLRGEFRLP